VQYISKFAVTCPKNSQENKILSLLNSVRVITTHVCKLHRYVLMLSFRLRFGLAVGRYISVQNISCLLISYVEFCTYHLFHLLLKAYSLQLNKGLS